MPGALSASDLGIADLTATQSSFTLPASGTWAPRTIELVLVAVMNRKGTATDIPSSLTGTNGFSTTWSQLATLNVGGNTLVRLTLFMGNPVNLVGGTLTAAFAAAQLQCAMAAVQIVNTRVGAISAPLNPVQIATGNIASGNSSANLAAFANGNNGTFLASAARASATGFTSQTSPLYPWFNSIFTGIGALGWEFYAGSDQNPAVSWAGVTNSCGIGCEIVENVLPHVIAPSVGRIVYG